MATVVVWMPCPVGVPFRVVLYPPCVVAVAVVGSAIRALILTGISLPFWV